MKFSHIKNFQLTLIYICLIDYSYANLTLVVNTWAFTSATDAAWHSMLKSGHALNAVEEGCSACERLQCSGTVGFGSHPDEVGYVSLDAMIFDGPTHKVGAVAGLLKVKSAISVARKVLENTEHTLLVGQSATDFAIQMGFKAETLETPQSYEQYQMWITNDCQPNYWKNVQPNPLKKCGPYKPIDEDLPHNPASGQCPVKANEYNHDTIGMIAIDPLGRIAVGTSTNGMNHKIAGRVGDTAIPGSGGYVDQDFGAAACTGDGDVIMRFSPAKHAILALKLNYEPEKAATVALLEIYKKYPKNMAAIIVVDKKGKLGAACFGIKKFPFSVITSETNKVKVLEVDCFV